MNKVDNLIANGWHKENLGQPRWRWFIKPGEKLDAFYYELNDTTYYATSFRAVVYGLPAWEISVGGRISEILFVDPLLIEKRKNKLKKFREGTGNVNSLTIRKIR